MPLPHLSGLAASLPWLAAGRQRPNHSIAMGFMGTLYFWFLPALLAQPLLRGRGSRTSGIGR
jgi:hypothetical protein